MWTRTGGEEYSGEEGGERPCGVISYPPHRTLPLNVCWRTSDNSPGSGVVFSLAGVFIFIERTSLLIKLCLLSGDVLLHVFVCFASLSQELCLSSDLREIHSKKAFFPSYFEGNYSCPQKTLSRTKKRKIINSVMQVFISLELFQKW